MTTSAITAQRHTAVEQLAPVLSDTTPVFGVVDFNILDQLVEYLGEIYPEAWLTHTVSVHTMGLPGVLEHFRARGLSIQTGSEVEVDIAQRSGYSNDQIIHTPPVKTREQLSGIIDREQSFCVENFAELTRVDELLVDPENYAGTIGLRITPQASADDNATVNAHLGIGLRDHRTDLIEAFLERPWLTQLYVSFDTPPATLQQTAEQVAAAYQFAEDIEHAVGAQRIQHLHFSSGLPGDGTTDDVMSSLDNHRFVHQAMIPELLDKKYAITRDFSKFLTAKAGMILARVEYTKDLDDRMIAVVHADPQADPQHTRIAAYDSAGSYKDNLQHYYYDVAGPTGLVAQRVELPELEEGDVLAILDVGASSFGSTSTLTTPVYGIRGDGLLTESSILSAGKSSQELADTAGIYQPAKLLY